MDLGNKFIAEQDVASSEIAVNALQSEKHNEERSNVRLGQELHAAADVNGILENAGCWARVLDGHFKPWAWKENLVHLLWILTEFPQIVTKIPIGHILDQEKKRLLGHANADQLNDMLMTTKLHDELGQEIEEPPSASKESLQRSREQQVHPSLSEAIMNILWRPTDPKRLDSDWCHFPFHNDISNFPKIDISKGAETKKAACKWDHGRPWMMTCDKFVARDLPRPAVRSHSFKNNVLLLSHQLGLNLLACHIRTDIDLCDELLVSDIYEP
jgi:hypothetical protein